MDKKKQYYNLLNKFLSKNELNYIRPIIFIDVKTNSARIKHSIKNKDFIDFKSNNPNISTRFKYSDNTSISIGNRLFKKELNITFKSFRLFLKEFDLDFSCFNFDKSINKINKDYEYKKLKFERAKDRFDRIEKTKNLLNSVIDIPLEFI